MKTSVLILCVMVVLVSFSDAGLTFTVKVDGVGDRNLLKEGLKPSEFRHLSIHSSEENVKISSFEILHVRGRSTVNRAVVTNANSYDLNNFRSQAKPGDRIVIKVSKLSGADGNQLSDKNSVIQIPVTH